MKKRMCAAALGLFLAVQAPAQAYKTAIGVRGEKNYGVSFQQKIAKNTSLEFIGRYNFRDKGSVSILAKQYKKLIFKNFTYFYGAGVSKGWLADAVDPTTEAPVKDPFAVAATAGVEMTFNRFNVSFDYQPSVNIAGGENFLEHGTAVTVRYVLFKEEKKGLFSGKNKKGKKSTGKKPIFGKKS